MESSYLDDILAIADESPVECSSLSPPCRSTLYQAALILGLQEELAEVVARRAALHLAGTTIHLIEPARCLDIPACSLAMVSCLASLDCNARTLRAAMKCNLHTALRTGACLTLNSANKLMLVLPLDVECFDPQALAAALLRFSGMARRVMGDIEAQCEL